MYVVKIFVWKSKARNQGARCEDVPYAVNTVLKTYFLSACIQTQKEIRFANYDNFTSSPLHLLPLLYVIFQNCEK